MSAQVEFGMAVRGNIDEEAHYVLCREHRYKSEAMSEEEAEELAELHNSELHETGHPPEVA
ncbi:hypothetical protein [Acaricomes phytoseiuli]|uniref:hypothetical protein n=1 Tax=Acaricomes phytoseiuli TaxID=291968 RepID=UPI00035E5792|nr:hypothetical protein [Acaricomes phytoseiuli]